jgi:hypothetical protein
MHYILTYTRSLRLFKNSQKNEKESVKLQEESSNASTTEITEKHTACVNDPIRSTSPFNLHKHPASIISVS